jgi:hypothetical protein
MFNVGALTASHRTDRMSENPIRISGKATLAMRVDDVTRKSLLLASSAPFGNPSRADNKRIATIRAVPAKMDDGTLITLVQNYEEIYSLKHREYCNQQRRDNIWEEIGKIMKQPG